MHERRLQRREISTSQNMGAATSTPAPTSGLVTVSRGRPESRGAPVDPDLAALRALPPVSPLLKPPSLRGLFSGRAAGAELPGLHPRNVSALCREYASLSRHTALPLCEEQRTLAKKIAGVEALCARVLYLMALRSSELSASVTTLRDMESLGESMDQLRTVLQKCVVRAEKLEQRLPSEGAAL